MVGRYVTLHNDEDDTERSVDVLIAYEEEGPLRLLATGEAAWSTLRLLTAYRRRPDVRGLLWTSDVVPASRAALAFHLDNMALIAGAPVSMTDSLRIVSITEDMLGDA